MIQMVRPLNNSMAALAAIILVVVALPICGFFGIPNRQSAYSVVLSQDKKHFDYYKKTITLKCRLSAHQINIDGINVPDYELDKLLTKYCLDNENTAINIQAKIIGDPKHQDIVNHIVRISDINESIWYKWNAERNQAFPFPYGKLFISILPTN